MHGALLRKLNQTCLSLHAREACPCVVRAKHADDPAAGAQLHHAVSGFCAKERAEPERVRIEALVIRVLIEHQPVVLQVVQPFHRKSIA